MFKFKRGPVAFGAFGTPKMASVKVAVRVRPFNKREENLGNDVSAVQVHGNQVALAAPMTSSMMETSMNGSLNSSIGGGSTPNRGKGHKFTFDYAYWSHNRQDEHFADQSKVFRELGTGVVDNAFDGYNVCVFAYGQTGSGKTYTMMGDSKATPVTSGGSGGESDGDVCETEDVSDRGLIPRICSALFRKIQGSSSQGSTYRTEVSYLEIYNETVKDLLAHQGAQAKLKLREHPKDGPYVENLTKHLAMKYIDILALMERGNKVRTTASTAMNDTSSRSHAIFTITFVNAGLNSETGLPHETVSKIHLVDLAGSERADATGATGQRLKEGAHINKSLVTLGSVISALSEAASAQQTSTQNKKLFIPYRDSTLTWLLKDSLGGNAKTIMIATISPAEVNHSETLSTLRYANRAKNIINKPTINEDVNVKLIRELRAEIERLRTVMNNDPSLLRKLEQKESQERQLTEEWTEKWKEAAKILKEQSALALKQMGYGVTLDSVKPHLVGIDEDVLSTGITLYHLKDGETRIGADPESDIVLKGANVMTSHCVVKLTPESVSLHPFQGAACIVNGETVTSAVRLSQGCVIILGKTNMFRYNDPKEAASMRRMNASINGGLAGTPQHGSQNNNPHPVRTANKLLSQSLSDLRVATTSSVSQEHLSVFSDEEQTLPENNVLNLSHGKTKKKTSEKQSTDSVMSQSSDSSAKCTNWLKTCDDSSSGRTEEVSTPDTGSSSGASGGATASSRPHPPPSQNDNSIQEMSMLYDKINQQKGVVLSCLESESCDVRTLEVQISSLQSLQNRYSKMEYERARQDWINAHQTGGDQMGDHFSRLVEQEVDKRLFHEKIMREQSEFQEREFLRMEKEREMAEIKRQHEREIYLLRRKLHEASTRLQDQPSSTDSGLPGEDRPFDVSVTIPQFLMTASTGQDTHIDYVIHVRTGADGKNWKIRRRFRQFRMLHQSMSSLYGPAVTSIQFPARKLFGNKSSNVAQERKLSLQRYLNVLIQACGNEIKKCPLYKNPTRDALIKLSGFFEQASTDADL